MAQTRPQALRRTSCRWRALCRNLLLQSCCAIWSSCNPTRIMMSCLRSKARAVFSNSLVPHAFSTGNRRPVHRAVVLWQDLRKSQLVHFGEYRCHVTEVQDACTSHAATAVGFCSETNLLNFIIDKAMDIDEVQHVYAQNSVVQLQVEHVQKDCASDAARTLLVKQCIDVVYCATPPGP